MYERRTVPSQGYAKIKLPEVCRHVLVNKFTEDSFEQFVKDCSSILNLGQNFLPIVIDSYGGFVHTVLSMIDFLESCDTKVVTVCESKAMSCGAVLMSCGSERYMGANATIMVHDIAGSFWGKNVELQNSVKESSRLDRKIYSLLDKNTNQPTGYWKSLVKENKYADLYLTPQKALNHKLITQIGIPHIETTFSVSCELVI